MICESFWRSLLVFCVFQNISDTCKMLSVPKQGEIARDFPRLKLISIVFDHEGLAWALKVKAGKEGYKCIYLVG